MNKFYIFFSNRLKFREWTASDAEFLHELNSDPNVLKYTGDPPFNSIAHAKSFIESYTEYKQHGYGRWLVELKETSEPIGWAGLKNQIHTEGFVDLGYRFLAKHWNKGYGTEAARACLKFGFNNLDLNEVTGRVALENVYSERVLNSIGMTLRSNQKKCHGLDARYYSITMKEYLENHPE